MPARCALYLPDHLYCRGTPVSRGTTTMHCVRRCTVVVPLPSPLMLGSPPSASTRREFIVMHRWGLGSGAGDWWHACGAARLPLPLSGVYRASIWAVGVGVGEFPSLHPTLPLPCVECFRAPLPPALLILALCAPGPLAPCSVSTSQTCSIMILFWWATAPHQRETTGEQGLGRGWGSRGEGGSGGESSSKGQG